MLGMKVASGEGVASPHVGADTQNILSAGEAAKANIICPHCDTNVSDPVKEKNNREAIEKAKMLTKAAMTNALRDQVSKKQRDEREKKEKKEHQDDLEKA